MAVMNILTESYNPWIPSVALPAKLSGAFERQRGIVIRVIPIPIPLNSDHRFRQDYLVILGLPD